MPHRALHAQILSAISPFHDDDAPKRFSEAVVDAVRGGCTEAIGLEDLLCRDMARKLTILARSALRMRECAWLITDVCIFADMHPEGAPGPS